MKDNNNDKLRWYKYQNLESIIKIFILRKKKKKPTNIKEYINLWIISIINIGNIINFTYSYFLLVIVINNSSHLWDCMKAAYINSSIFIIFQTIKIKFNLED